VKHGYKVTRAGDSRQGTVVAIDTGDILEILVMVMWDELRDGTPNTGGRAYWHPASSLVVI
jgi:hypothetical protein